MGLTFDHILQSTARLTAFFSASDEQKAAYAQALLEVVGWMEPDRFEDVCRAMAEEVALGRKPVPKQYLAIYRKLAQKKGWDRKNDPKNCTSCGGLSFVWGHYRHRQYGFELTAARRCPECCPGVQELKEELEPIEDPESVFTKFNRLSDEAKAHAFVEAEHMIKAFNLPERWMSNFLNEISP